MSSSKCINILVGHLNVIRSLSYIPDHSILASGSVDSQIKFWNLLNGVCVNSIATSHGIVRTMAYLKKRGDIASAGSDHRIKVYFCFF